MLNQLGTWIGRLTLGRDKPLLTRHLSLKTLLLSAYHAGRLVAVLPFAMHILATVVDSPDRLFAPPNPWTMSVLRVLALLCDAKPGLRAGLRFEIELVCSSLSVDLSTVEPTQQEQASFRQARPNAPTLDFSPVALFATRSHDSKKRSSMQQQQRRLNGGTRPQRGHQTQAHDLKAKTPPSPPRLAQNDHRVRSGGLTVGDAKTRAIDALAVFSPSSAPASSTARNVGRPSSYSSSTPTVLRSASAMRLLADLYDGASGQDRCVVCNGMPNITRLEGAGKFTHTLNCTLSSCVTAFPGDSDCVPRRQWLAFN
jgi:hypothetical protein